MSLTRRNLMRLSASGAAALAVGGRMATVATNARRDGKKLPPGCTMFASL